MAENMTMTTNLTASERDAEVARQRAAEEAVRRAADEEARRKTEEEHKRRLADEEARKRAEVHGVISFYHDFHVEPHTRPVIKLCRSESCQARGVEVLARAFEGETRVSIEPIYCLGLCTVGPNAMVGNTLHARLDTAKLSALVESVA